MDKRKLLTFVDLAEPAEQVAFSMQLLFGKPEIRESAMRIGFQKGAVFGIDRIVLKHQRPFRQIAVLEAVGPEEEATYFPNIYPAARCLLHATKRKAVDLFLNELESWRSHNIDPECVLPSYFAYLHGRLDTGLPFRSILKR